MFKLEIIKNLVVTNVTQVKIGRYGGFRVTLNCYDNDHPDCKNDDIYFVGLSLTSPALSDLLDQIGIYDDLDRKVPGNRIRLPSGIRINVTCNEIKRNRLNPRLRYVNGVSSIELVDMITFDVDVTFKASDIIFNDWGIVMETKDGVYTRDKYVLFNSHVPNFTSSSLMETIKNDATGDSVRLTGKARVYYSTFKNDLGNWDVKVKYRFDSRFDDLSLLQCKIELGTIMNKYIKKLKAIREKSTFKPFISKMDGTWKKRFVSESTIVNMASRMGIEIDPAMIGMTFLHGDDLDVYRYLKSLLTDLHDIHYFKKNEEFKYVIFHDMASRQSRDYGKNASKQKLIAYDPKMRNVYVFSCKEENVKDFLNEIVDAPVVLFLDRLVPKQSGFKLMTSCKIAPDPKNNVKDWLEPVAEALWRY